MSDVFKFLLFASIGVLLVWAGFFIYKKINKRIVNSDTGWQILGNGLLLFILLAVLFSGGIYLLIVVYGLLKEPPDTGTPVVI